MAVVVLHERQEVEVVERRQRALVIGRRLHREKQFFREVHDVNGLQGTHAGGRGDGVKVGVLEHGW